jgi:soluble lytic murein transglycosylase
MALTFIKWFSVSVCASVFAAAPLAACAQLATDTDVLAARDAVQRGNWKALDTLRPRFAGHVLEAYPSYWLLAGTVDRADPREVQAFLARYPSSPLAEGLRREWLKSLGASGSWDLFRAEHPRLLADDAEVTCYSFQERLARGDAEVAAEARALFQAGKEAPSSCEPVFATLVATHAVTEVQAGERLRKLLAAGLVRDAKRTNSLLPTRHAMSEKALDRAAADPGAFLAREKSPMLSRQGKELVLFALGRVSRSRPDEAAERLAQLAPALGTDARYAWGQLAWQAATAHHPRALEWYALAADTPLTEAQMTWRIRAALRGADWKAVLAGIQALPAEEAREPAWRYWRARALRVLGANEAADGLLRGLAGHPTFYSLLASDDLGIAVTPDWNAYRPLPADIDRVRAMDGIQRALVLYRVGLDNEALREWLWAIRGLDDRELLAAAEVARIANEPDRAINTANKTVQLHDYTQRFPTPHRDAMSAAARQWNLDEAMMYAIIRQESRFMTEARSRVGAMGLMQLMPATARWVARQIPVQPYDQDMLLRPEVNVNMGTYYFKRVLADLGDPILATAGYNAGPGRARRWRDAKPLEGAIYAETIPFNETRDYVKQVFTNTWFYRHRLTGKAASLKQILGTVPGRNSDTAAVAASAIP